MLRSDSRSRQNTICTRNFFSIGTIVKHFPCSSLFSTHISFVPRYTCVLCRNVAYTYMPETPVCSPYQFLSTELKYNSKLLLQLGIAIGNGQKYYLLFPGSDHSNLLPNHLFSLFPCLPAGYQGFGSHRLEVIMCSFLWDLYFINQLDL